MKKTLGKQNAKSLKSIAGAATRYRNASMTKGVDANRLMVDLLTHMRDNPQLAYSLFGSKQGARIATALGDPDTFHKIMEAVETDASGYAAKIAKERMSGFDGAVSKLQGSLKNLETSVGRAWDDGGKGGALTWVADKLGWTVQSLAEMDAKTTMATSAIAGGGALWLGLKGLRLFTGAAALSGSAVALDGSAAALTRAAIALGVGKAPGVAVPAVPVGAGLFTASAFLRGGSLAAMIAGLELMNLDSKKPDQPARTYLRSLFGIDDPKEAAPWMAGGAWNKSGTGDAAKPGVDTSAIDEAQIKVDTLKNSLRELGNMTVHPGIEPRIEGAPHIGGIGHASLEAPKRGRHSDIDFA